MSKRQRIRRAISFAVWRLFNPLARSLAGVAPWWVVLETTGRRSGEPRRCRWREGRETGRSRG